MKGNGNRFRTASAMRVAASSGHLKTTVECPEMEPDPMAASYEVEFEIAGPAAMFARPDTGSTPISYPVPTWSACKAMFESVARGVLHGSASRDNS